MFDTYIKQNEKEMHGALQRLIRIPSIKGDPEKGAPFGAHVAKALGESLNIASELGFKTKGLDGYIGYAEFGTGEDYVAVLGHVDVVPTGDGWTIPPFEGRIQDGRVWGRGAMDDKGPLVAALFALKAIKESGVKLSKKVRIIFGTNEENGCEEIPYYLDKEECPVAGFTPDAEFPVVNMEKGVFVFEFSIPVNCNHENRLSLKLESIKGGHRPNMVPDTCDAIISGSSEALTKLYAICNKTDRCCAYLDMDKLELSISTMGISVHSSTPELGENAITKMFRIMDGVVAHIEVQEYLEAVIWAIRQLEALSGREESCFVTTPGLTVNIGTVKFDNGSLRLTADIRFPASIKGTDLQERLETMFNSKGLSILKLLMSEPLYYNPSHPMIRNLQKAYEQVTGNEAKLIAKGGSTYAKAMPNIVAFGPLFPGQPDQCHKVDESIAVEDLYKCTLIYAEALYKLAR